MKPDLVPLVAWIIIWEMFFEEPESTDQHHQDNRGQDPPDTRVKGSSTSVGSKGRIRR